MTKPILFVKVSERDQLRRNFFVDHKGLSVGSQSGADFVYISTKIPRRYTLVNTSGKNIFLNIPAEAAGEVVKEDVRFDFAGLKMHGFLQSKNGSFPMQLKEGQYGQLQWAGLTFDFDYRFPKSYYSPKIDLSAESHEVDQNLYGAPELKRIYRKNMFSGLTVSVTLHLALTLGFFLAILLFTEKAPLVKTIKITKYSEIGPPPSIYTPPAAGDAVSGDKGTPAEKKSGGQPSAPRDISRLGVLGALKIGQNADASVVGFGFADKMESAFGNTDQPGGGGDAEWGDNTYTVASYGDSAFGDVVKKPIVPDKTSSIKMERAGDIAFDKPSEVAGEGSSSAFRSPDAIRKAIMSQMEGIRYCFNQSLKRQSDLAGKIELEFTILTNGKVQQAKTASSSLNVPELEGCVLEVVKRWRFQPIIGGDVDVIYPLVFVPKN